MYRYDEFDHAFVQQRVAQFRDQVSRRLDGSLSEAEFKPLRLMNGVYLQLHAYMLRVAIPYGVLSARQLRTLAHIARTYDKGFGHFTTRQNIQYNWPRLVDISAILTDLAGVGMHAIQTSGNCIRNVTSDPFAGVAVDELEDPRVYCEIIRQWSTLHPEFAFLPRKFKIAVSGAATDRAAVKFHDIGIYLRRNEKGETGFEILAGGGQGRTPMVAQTVRAFLPGQHLLSYLEAILRVYNRLGRRDNKYKARIKILIHATGMDRFRQMVEEEWETIRDLDYDLPEVEMRRILAYFAPPAYEVAEAANPCFEKARLEDQGFADWARRNVHDHRQPGYAIVTVSLKPEGGIPGDADDTQMDLVADLAERYSLNEVRVTHRQNLVLPHVKRADLHAVFRALIGAGLATPNEGLATDIIACPGLDYCSLANARSIPVAQRLTDRLADLRLQHDIGDLHLNISGCINACGHHHVGAIGLLGVDRRGEEYYQLTLGGSAFEDASVGRIVGPAFSGNHVVDAVDTVIRTYLDIRQTDERLLDTVRRVDLAPFREALYGTD